MEEGGRGSPDKLLGYLSKKTSTSKSLRDRFEQIRRALMMAVDDAASKDSGGVVKEPVLN